MDAMAARGHFLLTACRVGSVGNRLSRRNWPDGLANSGRRARSKSSGRMRPWLPQSGCLPSAGANAWHALACRHPVPAFSV